MVEHEFIFLGLELAKNYGIGFLDIVGNSNPIVTQVKGKFACENKSLKRYRDAMRLDTNNFNALSFQLITRVQELVG